MISLPPVHRKVFAFAGIAVVVLTLLTQGSLAQTQKESSKKLQQPAAPMEDIKETPPREPPYTEEDSNEEETASGAEALEEENAGQSDAPSEEPSSESEETETAETPSRPPTQTTKGSARDNARALGRNPYTEGDYSGQKDRFGRRDPRDRTFSKDNDELVRKGLLRVSKSGEFIYTYPESEQNNAFGIRFGTFSPPNLTNPNTGTSFQSLYGADAKSMILFEYEWQFLKLPIGKLGLGIGTGISTATGAGFYRNPSLQPSPRAEEIYNFYMFPSSVSAIYRVQFFDRQILVPYGTAGVDYFGILETRDDGGSTKLGGGGGFHIGAGASIQLDFLSKQSMFDLDQEFGINHIYLTVDFKYINGLSSAFNITQNLLSGGILAEF